MLEHEFIPAPDKSSRRLMIMMHGLGDSIDGYRWMPEAVGLSWLNYLLVNAPDEYYGGYSWFDFMGNPLPGIARSRQLMFEVLDAQVAKGTPADQIFVGGFSQGCLMAIEIGMRYPKRLAGILGISGVVSQPELLLKEKSPVATQQRFLVTHGTFDQVLPFARTFEQIKLLQAAGVNIDFHEFRKDHTIAGETELNLIRDFLRAGVPAANVGG